jgi:hypothetical protein
MVGSIFGLVFLALLATAVPSPSPAVAAGSCDIAFFNGLGLARTTLTAPTPAYAIRNPGAYPQTSPVSHCEVIGYINPRTGVDGKPYAIGFHLRLPDAWNGRFYFQGGGGTDGNLGDALGGGALAAGYAVVSTDAGHDNTINNDPNVAGTAAFGVDPQARIDYGYNAVDKVTQTSKTIIKKYYARDIAYSYFVGCSNGGRQGMVASQRFPTYFDGIVAGDPIFTVPKAAMAGAWNEQALAPLATRLSSQGQPYIPDTFSNADLTLAANAILAGCDALDGLVDGIVDNYPACTNDVVYPQLDAIQCSGAKTATCLSAGQITALKKIYAGPVDSHGHRLYADWQWDGGISGSSSLRSWTLGAGPYPNNNGAKLTLGAGSLALVFMTPPDITPSNALETYMFNFNLDLNAPRIWNTFGMYTESSMDFMNGAQTDLWDFMQHRGKMILYQGNSDGSVSPHDTIGWYKATGTAMGINIQNFARFFLVPGMGHCSGGPGTTQFDTLTPIVKWVEQGTAPDVLVATAPSGTPWPGRTRPLCPYPTIASYGGSGSIEGAANFICVPPVQVSIDPNPLYLHRRDALTVYITLPKGFEAKDWGIGDVTCYGAKATGGFLVDSVYGPTYGATFRTQDLVGVPTGNAVPFNVGLTFHYQGKQASLQASTTAQVVP